MRSPGRETTLGTACKVDLLRTMNSRDQIRVGETTIHYDIRRSRRRRKTIQLTVDRDGVHIAVPARTSDRKVRSIVRDRADWIGRQQAALRDAPEQRFADGETIMYLGRQVPMAFEQGKARRVDVRFDGSGFRVSVPTDLPDSGRHEQVRLAFIDWYRDRAAEHLGAVVDHWWPQLGQDGTPKILIRNQHRRWGSCAADGTLRFNWRVMLLEPELIDYIVVHELAHLTHMNHSPAFWELVCRTIPDAQERRKRLRETSRALPF